MTFDKSEIASILARSPAKADLPTIFEYLRQTTGLAYDKEEGGALQALQGIGGTETEDFLIDLLQTHTVGGLGAQRAPGFGDLICLVLGRMGCKRAAAVILEHVEGYQRETVLGREAIAALGHLGYANAVPILLAIALAHTGVKGMEAMRSLRLIGADSVYPVLAEALNSTERRLREKALQTLFIIATPEADAICRRTFVQKVLGKRKWIDDELARWRENHQITVFLRPEELGLVSTR